jgi:hypothetical protein
MYGPVLPTSTAFVSALFRMRNSGNKVLLRQIGRNCAATWPALGAPVASQASRPQAEPQRALPG